MLWAACKSASACARSSVMTGDCWRSASWMAVWLGARLSGGRRNPPLRRARRIFIAPVASGSSKIPIGVGDGNGVAEHLLEDGIERKLGVQQLARFKQKIQFAQAAGGARFGAGDVLDASEHVLHRAGMLAAGAEDDFVGVFETEGDGVAVLEFAAFDLFAVHEEAAFLSAVFQIELVGFIDDGRA